jgi:integrase
MRRLVCLAFWVWEARNVDVDHLGLERWASQAHGDRQGGKTALVSLPPRVARAVDLAADQRLTGPVLLSRSDGRLDCHGAARVVRRVARRAGITKRISPHSLRHSFITAALDAGVSLRDVQIAAVTPTRGPRPVMTVPSTTWTATPAISSPRSSLAPPDPPGTARG